MYYKYYLHSCTHWNIRFSERRLLRLARDMKLVLGYFRAQVNKEQLGTIDILIYDDKKHFHIRLSYHIPTQPYGGTKLTIWRFQTHHMDITSGESEIIGYRKIWMRDYNFNIERIVFKVAVGNTNMLPRNRRNPKTGGRLQHPQYNKRSNCNNKIY